MTRRPFLAVVSFALVISGCTNSTSPATTTAAPSTTVTTSVTTTSAPSSSTTASSGPPSTTAAPEDHWIRVAGRQFIDTRVGTEFVPLGVNLLLKTGGGGGDKMFALYDSDWVEEQLTGIAAMGFNTVRFFLDMCMACTSDETGILPGYLDNLADLLTRLEAHDLVALPTSNDVPDPGFSNRLPCCEPFGGYRNSLYLSADGHRVAADYWRELLTGLHERGAPTHHVLGWQLANEQFVLRDVPPISLREGIIIAADGAEYDLADDHDVAAMVVNGLRRFVTTVGDAIRETDPDALVTMGFFSAEDPDAGRDAADNRWVVPDRILQESTLDFVDLHAYPGLGGTWPAIAAAYRLNEIEPRVPVILGEFGAFTSAYPTVEDAAAAMARWQAGSCDLGFDGWLLWFWGADADDEVYPVNIADGAVARAISPLVRPDPCEVGPYASANLALDRPVTASAEESEEYDATRAVDGSIDSWWSAAEGPPQWIEVDLEDPVTISRVEILIGSVSPPGLQTHRVRVRGAGEPGPGTIVAEFTGDVAQGTTLNLEFEPVADVRYVRVETLLLDGWVIIHEVGVYAQ